LLLLSLLITPLIAVIILSTNILSYFSNYSVK